MPIQADMLHWRLSSLPKSVSSLRVYILNYTHLSHTDPPLSSTNPLLLHCHPVLCVDTPEVFLQGTAPNEDFLWVNNVKLNVKVSNSRFGGSPTNRPLAV